jgi:hypothetical protein
VRQWLEGVLLDITLMERRYVGELHSRRLRPDIVLEKRAPKYIIVEAENPPQGKNEKPGFVYTIDTDGGCTTKKLSYAALKGLATPTTPPWVYAPIRLPQRIGLLGLLGNPNNTSL